MEGPLPVPRDRAAPVGDASRHLRLLRKGREAKKDSNALHLLQRGLPSGISGGIQALAEAASEHRGDYAAGHQEEIDGSSLAVHRGKQAREG